MNQPITINSIDLLNSIKGKVLLVNPPIFDSRYPWIKWNQPLSLLKLATFLIDENDCDVKLFDFMLPSNFGKVPKLSLPANDAALDEPTKWHFGKPWKEFEVYLDNLAKSKWIPDFVWIDTLTSFWWQSIPLVADRIKNRLKGSKIIVSGNYPIFELDHARTYCFNVDFVVCDGVSLTNYHPNLSIYQDQKPSFLALDLFNNNLLSEMERAISLGISHFTFFNEDIFVDFDKCLKPLLTHVIERNLKVYFHAICGVEIRNFPFSDAALLADSHFCELHIEPAYKEDGTVDEELYRRVLNICEAAGLVSKRGIGWEARNNYISGFIWIGKPDDDINKLVYNAVKIVQLTGMVIPKPFSPTPKSKDYELLNTRIDYISPEDVSPHRLPFSKINGVSKEEYDDLYRLTAFLNMKVRGHTYDFMANNYLAKVFRESLLARRWDR